VFFMEPTPTPYDLRWTMFGIPVRVHPMFWLVSVIMGWNTIRSGLHFLLIWVACMFVSILVHELGHVWMGQAFGSRGHIVLYGFGGLAIGSNQLRERRQRILVSFAGPLAGIILVFLWASNPQAFPAYLGMLKSDFGFLPNADELGAIRTMPRTLMITVSFLMFINLLWGFLNLFPVWPLDGGQICRELCEGTWPDVGLVRSLAISLIVAGLLAVHCLLSRFGMPIIPLRIGSVWGAIMFGVLAFQSYQLLQQAQRRSNDPWDQR
jgi:stage IV sporulation protein FB